MGDVAPSDAGPPEAHREPPPPPSPGDAPASAASGSSPAPAPPPDPASPTAILDALGRALPPETIDELWIFPQRRIGPGQSTIVVASILDPDPDSDRRRIFTARFTLVRPPRGQPELRQEMTEEGAAPAALVARVVDGAVRRLDDEPAPPRHARIAGDLAAWAALLRVVGAAPDA